MAFNLDTFYAYRSKFTAEHDAIQVLLSALQTDIHTDAKKPLFDMLGFSSERPYYCCQTGLSGRIYTDMLNVTGKAYETLCYSTLYPGIHNLLDASGYHGYPYLNHTEGKLICIIFQPTDTCQHSPHELAEQIHTFIQSAYEEHFAQKTGRYHNTTVLSDAVSGIDGIYEGVTQTRRLHRLSFFRMAPGVMDHERLNFLRNNVHYNQVMFESNALCSSISAGLEAQSLAQLERLFLDTLKYSFSFDRLNDVLSYLKYYLAVRMTVFDCLPEDDLDDICNRENYMTIEECFEALRPLISSLSQAIQKTGDYKTSVATAAYYILQNLNRDISLDDIALYANTTSSHLSTVFHQQTGMTTKQYQTKARIKHAKHLLMNTSKRIGDIAAECGFYNRRYFTYIFKEHCGVTPQEYRCISIGKDNSPLL